MTDDECVTKSWMQWVCLLTLWLALTLSPLRGETAFAHTQGANLVDATGKPLLLRGINLGNWLEQEGYMFLFEKGPASPREIEALFDELAGPAEAARFWREYRRNYITERDVELIRRAGFNSVRIPLHAKFFEAGNTEGFELVDHVVAWCKRAGLKVILDLHCAPGGQTGTNIDDSWGYPWLFEESRDQQDTIDMWRRIAGHYVNEPTVLGYDLLNEPIPHFPSLRKYNAALEPLYRRIAKAVREVDRNHVLIFGGAQWDGNFGVFGPPFDRNAMYTFHKYWVKPDQASIAEYLTFRDRYHVPIWLGESGENTDEWVGKFRGVLERHQVGWCFWPYKKMERSSAAVSILKPAHWDAITAYAALPAGTGDAEKRIAARPPIQDIRAAMRDLLIKIRVENCRVNAGYLRALGMRDVSAQGGR